jgi:hypothetical protein
MQNNMMKTTKNISAINFINAIHSINATNEINDIAHINAIKTNDLIKPFPSRIYLCWEDTNFKSPTTHLPINGFKCYRYNSFHCADYAWKNIIKPDYEPHKLRNTIIPINFWVPIIFDKYIINYQLKKMYWLGDHSFGIGDSSNDD